MNRKTISICQRSLHKSAMVRHRQRHVFGKEIEALPGFLIPIADAVQGQGFFAIGDLDDVIGSDTRCQVRGFQ